ncbi:MAG: class I SAM-dependent methyltransferase [Burkholderiales bacterium]|nr:class I SAM-dependent methyltransferase [Burkholderiales bacterium]
MYDERADFQHHMQEVDEAFDLLSRLSLWPNPMSVALDIGGGQGMHCGFLQRRCESVFCADIIDYSSLYEGSFPQKLREKHERNHHALDLSRCAFVKTDAMRLLFRDGFFDMCFSFNAFEHIPNPTLAFMEVLRTLRTGGIAYISLDPIWSCDSGSHFSHQVRAPWQHLISSTAEFRTLMRAGGATDAEIAEFPGAMNQCRAVDFNSAVSSATQAIPAEVVLQDSYSGLCDPLHAQHPNFEAAKRLGFSPEELTLRRLRWIIKKL